MKSKLMWRPFKSYMLISIASIILIGGFVYISLSTFFMSQVVKTIEVRARVAALRMETEDFSFSNRKRIQKIAETIGIAANSRITVIDRYGQVLGDTVPQAETIMNRPEFSDALAGKLGVDLRTGRSGQQTIYVALPIKRDGEVVGSIRAAKNLQDFFEKRNELLVQFTIFIAALLVAMTGLGYLLSRKYSKPLKVLNAGARKFAAGDFSTRITLPPAEELATLADSFNYMAETIQTRMDIIISQSSNLNAILNSMTGALIAVDGDETVVDVNPAALAWLGLSRKEIEGRSMHEVVKHKALQTFIRESLQNKVPDDADITIFLDNEHVLNVKSSPIYGANNIIDGCVVVFYDVTKMRQLENLRRDFVSNVSHEIRTPLTVIKGSAEILSQALANDAENIHFLEIINKHTERLTSLINDLLLLSRVEQTAAELQMETTSLNSVILTAINAVCPKIKAKNIHVTQDFATDIKIKANSGLLEQALINLIDNAVKYSEPNSEVKIKAVIEKGMCRISVTDNGPGIESKHFGRLFERFYRVDEARSRKVGGTGLGLAIVKHIARAHNGAVELDSEPGRGSTFSIILPAFLPCGVSGSALSTPPPAP